MILVYSHITSSRLQYICSFIFKELIGVDFAITIDSEEFKDHEGAKINYSSTAISPGEYRIQNHTLLFEAGIKEQSIECFETNKYKAFFKTANGDLSFDVLAASFYLVTRYEEYLPHAKDTYGRFAHENSLAFKKGFLNLPLVNMWVKDLAEKLKEKFSTFAQHPANDPPSSIFNFIPTYDIDIAYSYKYKGLLRNMGGFLRSPSKERIKVLAGTKADPFDSYAWLDRLHQQNDLHPLYFFLVAEENAEYDKNILPNENAMWRLVRQHAKKYPIGLHPSWQSGDNLFILKKEKLQLEAMAYRGQAIDKSRQHYLRFNLPEGYSRLIKAGISDEYSMGYASINGFRASVASSFFWYHLEKEVQTALRVHPFCFMDANSFYEQQLSPQQAYEELLHYFRICKEVDGTLITIWHNNFFGTDEAFKGWKEIYEQFIVQVQQ